MTSDAEHTKLNDESLVETKTLALASRKRPILRPAEKGVANVLVGQALLLVPTDRSIKEGPRRSARPAPAEAVERDGLRSPTSSRRRITRLARQALEPRNGGTSLILRAAGRGGRGGSRRSRAEGEAGEGGGEEGFPLSERGVARDGLSADGAAAREGAVVHLARK